MYVRFPYDAPALAVAYHHAHPRITRAQHSALMFGVHYGATGRQVPTVPQYRAATRSGAAATFIGAGLRDARRIVTLCRWLLEFGADARSVRSDAPAGTPAQWAIAEAAVGVDAPDRVVQ